HLPFDRLLAHTTAPVWSVSNTAESPDTPSITAHGWDPVVGDAARLVKQLTDLRHDGYRVVICADGDGSAGRIAAALRNEGFDAPPVVVQPLERGSVISSIKLAVLAEPDVTGRRRAHRRPRARRAITEAFFEDL